MQIKKVGRGVAVWIGIAVLDPIMYPMGYAISSNLIIGHIVKDYLDQTIIVSGWNIVRLHRLETSLQDVYFMEYGGGDTTIHKYAER